MKLNWTVFFFVVEWVQVNPLVINLPDPAAAAPVAAADPAVAVVPASPNGAGVPVSTQRIFPRRVHWFDWLTAVAA